MRRFWDQNYGGQGYDSVARRKGAPADPPATIAPLSTARSGSSGTLNVSNTGRAGGKTPIGGHRSGSAQSSEAVMHLRNQVSELSSHLEGLEKERDFYFAKVCVLVLPHLFFFLTTRYRVCSYGRLRLSFNNNWKCLSVMEKPMRRSPASRGFCTLPRYALLPPVVPLIDVLIPS